MEITLKIPSSIEKKEQLDEDTFFETYFEGGKIHIRTFAIPDHEDEHCDEKEEGSPCEELSGRCWECPYYCDIYKCCTYQE